MSYLHLNASKPREDHLLPDPLPSSGANADVRSCVCQTPFPSRWSFSSLLNVYSYVRAALQCAKFCAFFHNSSHFCLYQ